MTMEPTTGKEQGEQRQQDDDDRVPATQETVHPSGEHQHNTNDDDQFSRI